MPLDIAVTFRALPDRLGFIAEVTIDGALMQLGVMALVAGQPLTPRARVTVEPTGSAWAVYVGGHLRSTGHTQMQARDAVERMIRRELAPRVQGARNV